jgi:hypothetical protein
MGYETRYEISTSPISDEVIDAVKTASGYTYLFDDSCKWYDHEEHCKAVSKMYPEVLIEISGEGEESGDIWKKYFLNGKMQECRAKFSIPPFDKSKLV